MGDDVGATPSGREVDLLFDTALDAMAHGDAVTAVNLFERILTIDPSHTEATHGLIRALEDAGRVDDALRLTQELIAANPDDVLAMTRLSMICQHKGMVPEAEAAAAKAKILGWKMQLRDGIETKTDL
jgi:Flp pilus assembly protein TadD